MRRTSSALLLLLLPCFAHADRSLELRLLPGHVGYSNFSGFFVGGKVALAVPLAERWQWELGSGLALTSRMRSHFSLFTGPRFNLSEDRSRSWFVGLALIYGDEPKCCRTWEEKFAGTIEVGKRFRLNETGTWTLGPSVSWTTNGEASGLSVYPINFGYSF